jgi:hypothetical protein
MQHVLHVQTLQIMVNVMMVAVQIKTNQDQLVAELMLSKPVKVLERKEAVSATTSFLFPSFFE